ncbi:MAG: phosphomannose isomerase type II C-terminal cupin domain [Candidatus Paceibacterota bacterium]|jgi:mannose-6-phosphate isomerase-like protein (cupin superfamily)
MKTLTVKKPWGQFDQFTHNEITTVKILSVNRGGSLSLQDHGHRTEFWRIISGHPVVTVGEDIKNANPGDEFTIEKLQPHQLEALNDDVQVLEIAYGNFDEEDIVRIKDKYGRI